MSSKSETLLLLSNLANLMAPVDDEFSNNPLFQSSHPKAAAVAEALKKQREEEEIQIAAKAASEIKAMHERAATQIEESRRAMASHRRMVNENRDRIERIAVARLYADRTFNFLPLAREVGLVHVPMNELLSKPEFTIPPMEAEKLLKEIREVRSEQKTAARKAAK